eukprot:jgi/Undpi1/12824/HiC_scaffold_7.g02491.m1
MFTVRCGGGGGGRRRRGGGATKLMLSLASTQTQRTSQDDRRAAKRGLASNGATVLDFPGGDGGGSSRPSLLPNASQLLMSAARNNSKRKRDGDGAEGSKGKGAGGGGKGKGGTSQKDVTKQGGLSPTLVVCDADAFSSGRVRREIERILSKHPLKDKASEVKVVGSAWLSECLRLNSIQPMGQHLLETVTPGTVSSFAKRKIGGGGGAAANIGGAAAATANGGGGASSSKPSASSWGCLSPPPSKNNPWSTNTNNTSASTNTTTNAVGLGAGLGGADGPGELATEPVWKDIVSESDDGSGGDGDGGGEGEGRWEELMEGSVLRWVPATERVSSHILAFDMDGTLIKTKSGARFGDSVGDWQLLHPSIPTVLRSWHDRGYKVAIISNQHGVGTGKVDKTMLKAKVQAVIKALGVPVEALLACQNDYYRKPRLGCWELLTKSNDNDGTNNSTNNNDSDISNGRKGFEVVKEACLYVGDAAGRPKQGTYKKDFSAGDLKLALNAGIPFQTPEQFFLRSTQPLHKNRSLALLGFDPSTLRSGSSSSSSPDALDSLENCFVGGGGGGERGGAGGGLELVVLVGPPAGGKSKLCEDRLGGYVRVNQDELSSLSRCQRVAIARLKEKKNVVIDATNPSVLIPEESLLRN